MYLFASLLFVVEKFDYKSSTAHISSHKVQAVFKPILAPYSVLVNHILQKICKSPKDILMYKKTKGFPV